MGRGVTCIVALKAGDGGEGPAQLILHQVWVGGGVGGGWVGGVGGGGGGGVDVGGGHSWWGSLAVQQMGGIRNRAHSN